MARRATDIADQFQQLDCNERTETIRQIMCRCGGPADFLAEVLEIIGKSEEKISTTSIGSEASEVLLKIAMVSSGSAFWSGCVSKVPARDLVQTRTTISQIIAERKRKVQEKLREMDWTELETVLPMKGRRG